MLVDGVFVRGFTMDIVEARALSIAAG
jgi:hypothetical protein